MSGYPATLHPYAVDVLEGRVVVGELVRLGCERSRRDHETARERGLHFDPDAAQHAVRFFEFVRHSKGEWAGQVLHLAPWQAFILWELFGWLRADGSRRFRTAYAEVAKKNGKSTLLSGVGLYMTVGDGEPGAEVYTAATKLDQARIIHDEALRMLKSSPELSRRLTARHRNISDRRTASKFEPLGSDSDTQDGLNVHCALIDELHRHKSRALYEVLEHGAAARRSPLIFAITTAGDDETSFCFEQRTLCEQVLRRVLEDDSLFAFIACLDEGDDWRDPAVWVKANPNLGVSVKREQIAEQVEAAKRSPTKEAALRRYRMNSWVRATSRFLRLDAWDACAGDAMPAQIETACRGRPMYAGLDLASTNDITAFVCVFPPAEEHEKYRVLARFWIPADDLAERAKRTRLPYDLWVREGWIRATEGNVTDYRVVRDDILALCERFDLVSCGFDPWNSTATINELTDALGDTRLVKVRGNIPNMSPGTKMLERLVLSRQLEHGGNPVLRWMADNLEVREYQGAIGPVKPDHKMSAKKIDGMVALILALSRIEAGVADRPKPSVYATRGLTTL